ncbi:hypothetical protein [Bradyrhizobium sp. 192]|uniref:hypothetical protein n=1 Tax=Bradyrhizobium sp. 192 TaxID=2782660 RepID=UPI001FFF79A5|nr:hypothetical protein [Bradyrhizobium sp. 192]UPJ55443.1 hypothetical protein IVB24_22560 [Bradyrhizobium sp. 192]
MTGISYASLMTQRVESCFREIAAAARGDRASDAGGTYANRGAVLAEIRLIKAKAREAEILLRAARSNWPLIDGSLSSFPGRGDD